MTTSTELLTKSIRIRTLHHRETDLLMAVSEDMPGLIVHGRSEDELISKVPGRLRDLLEADGYAVLQVELVRDERATPADFGPPAFIAKASLGDAQK